MRTGQLTAALALAGCVILSCADRPLRPHVLLIVVDTLRADRLGCYGGDPQTAPKLDAFAAESRVYERSLSHAADTRFSSAAMFSGFLPHETHILERAGLPEGVDTLTEILARNGYRTAAVVGNYVLRGGRGFEQGFEIYDDAMQQREAVRGSPERTAAPTTNRAVELLEQLAPEGPLFLYLHYQDPHGPYTPPEQLVADSPPGAPVRRNAALSGRGGVPVYQHLEGVTDAAGYAARYEGEIRHFDREFGRLVAALRRLDLYDDAVIVLTSDHGEGLGEHDYWFAHGEYLYDHQIHVPLIARWGDRWTGRRGEYVQHIDLLPSLLDLLGIETGTRYPGSDLFEDRLAERSILSEMSSPLVRDRLKFSLVREGLKLIYTPRGDRYELYDLGADREESRNLILDPAYRDRIESMRGELHRLRSADRPGIENPDRPELSEEELERLRSLGYAE